VTDRLTLDDLRNGPPTIDIPTASEALGISRSYGFELAKRGEFPCRVITVGNRLRVVTASLLALLDVA
jgi:predicted DNA-binding transcriptional regulator AlpA